MVSAGSLRRPLVRLFIAGVVPLGSVGASLAAPAIVHATAVAPPSCMLASPSGAVSHVIYVQFDNTHFRRDNPNVPSDLEQMPNLLNFLKANGVVLTNHHTPLISHTATDILTSLTGVYGDRHGVPVSNTFRYFNPDGTSNLGVSFAYWTAPIFDPTTSAQTDTKFNMLTADGKNAPAPWVPFTRAGCNVGAVATANTVLENNSVDIPTVFGSGSPESMETSAQKTADFVGIGVHCGNLQPLCLTSAHAKEDKLPDEPGGYAGYKALFGHKYTAEAIGPITDLDGNTISGFPGFDGMTASVSLGYVAAMQEHGIPVTYAYISDVHDKHTSPTRAYGPGEQGYVTALKTNDTAFKKFFDRLNEDGINRSNTLFVFTSDENDHLSSGPPDNPACDGVTVACTYSHIGELNTNFAGLLATERGNTTPFKVHSDDAPTVYITGNPPLDSSVTRLLEQDAARLTASNPRTGNTDRLTDRLANPVEMKLLHMITADAARTPSFTEFANPDYFLFAGAPNCTSPCVAENPGFAWNHGDYHPDITTTWLGIAGPGVANPEGGVRNDVWSDHTDIRPTIMSLTGLKDDYQHQGRVLFELMKSTSVPPGVLVNQGDTLQVAQVYKQIEAPVGELGLNSLIISTCAESSTDNGVFADREAKLAAFSKRRDDIGNEMATKLEGAEFTNTPIAPADAKRLTKAGNDLRADVAKVAAADCSLAAQTNDNGGGNGNGNSGTGVATLAQTGGGSRLPMPAPLGLLFGATLLGFGLRLRRSTGIR
jgi:arylsulfatase A-like enzyme